MSCDRFKSLITAYIDDELPPEQRALFEDHLASCEQCARDLAEFAKLKEELDMLKFKEPTDAELDRYWRSVYNRLERGVAWVLFSVGAMVLLSYGAFKLIEETITDPGISIVLKVGLLAAVFGTVILFVSLLRERLAVRTVDKYSKEVER